MALLTDAPVVDTRKGGPPGDRILWPFLRMYAEVEKHETWSGTFLKRPLTPQEAKKGLDPAERDEWGFVLDTHLEVVQPSLIISMGKHVTAWLLNQPKVRMETVHGLAYPYGDATVVPAFHPSAGLTDSKRLSYTVADFKAAANVFGLWEPATRARTFRAATRADINLVRSAGTVAIDTEYDPKTGEPIMLTFSTRPDNGFAIWATDRPSLLLFGLALRSRRPRVVFHNALADLRPLKAMGIDIVG
ncbi:MAG: hypothetical protein ACREJF_07015, partial [Candidatus Methylomirabilales bacterium]